MKRLTRIFGILGPIKFYLVSHNIILNIAILFLFVQNKNIFYDLNLVFYCNLRDNKIIIFGSKLMKIVRLFFNNKLTGDKTKMAKGRSDFKEVINYWLKCLRSQY